MERNPFDKLFSAIFRKHAVVAKVKPDTLKALTRFAQQDLDELLAALHTSSSGLTHGMVAASIKKHGLNVVTREKRKSWPIRLGKILVNPLVLLLILLMFISILTSDRATALIIGGMVLISVTLRFYQENQAYNAAQALKSMVKTTTTVLREGKSHEVVLSKIVPGDILQLSAGDVVPADARLISSKDLFVNQSLLTGESFAAEKHVKETPREKTSNPLALVNICYMGTNVESGTAEAVVVATGSNTYFGSLAKDVVGEREKTNFDKGIDRFTWLMMGFMAIMAPAVFFINGFGKGNWWEAFLFAVSVTVGLTPEMLPAIVTVNLSKGAIAMAKKKVIVKRLSSIQNFGAMDILCTDKTGTLTENKVVLIKNIDINQEDDVAVLHRAYLNSYYQTGFKNLLDGAVLRRGKNSRYESLHKEYEKVDELPFDFDRRRLSVIVKNKTGKHELICKGAVEEVTRACTHYELHGEKHLVTAETIDRIRSVNHALSQDGYRVIAVAYRSVEKPKSHYVKNDEKELTFLGFMTFFDPPKASAAAAIQELMRYGVQVKVLTGDNELVTRKVCHDVGLSVDGILLGEQIDKLDEAGLEHAVITNSIFAKLSPEHKKMIVQALQRAKHVVGFLGDGVNDAPGLRAADVGISVDTEVDIARESADIILMEMSLAVLKDGVIEGRKVFGNITKYIKMGASSNFGNMFSMLGASLLLPFLPMLPIQLLTNNLLYDFSQATIPSDNVDEEYIDKPRKWDTGDIGRYMVCIGTVSSLFDYATFAMMWFVFGGWHSPAIFQTGWFVESLLTQTLIVHVIRSRKIPFIQTMASRPLLISTALVMAAGIYIVQSPLALGLGFVRLPLLYWPLVAGLMVLYVFFTQIVKTWYIKKFGYN